MKRLIFKKSFRQSILSTIALAVFAYFAIASFGTAQQKRKLPDGRYEVSKHYSKGNTDHAIIYFDNPCITIRKLNVWEVYPEQFTIEDLKKLSTFPDWFQFKGTYNEQWARIGDAVPPNFMYAIANHIKENILDG